MLSKFEVIRAVLARSDAVDGDAGDAWLGIGLWLVTIWMVGILLFPSIRRSLHGRGPSCTTNLQRIATALEMYSTDNTGRFPTSLRSLVPQYLESMPTCPVAGCDTYTHGYSSTSNPDGYTVACSPAARQGGPDASRK